MKNLGNFRLQTENSNFILESKNGGTNSKSKFKTTRLTGFNVKTLSYLGNK